MSREGDRIVVTGSRYLTAVHMPEVCDRLNFFKPVEIAHGGAAGADAIANGWAKLTETPCRVFPADWARWGRAAGPKRNREMLEIFRPDRVLAFPMEGKANRGTNHCVGVAWRELGIPVVIVTVRPTPEDPS